VTDAAVPHSLPVASSVALIRMRAWRLDPAWTAFWCSIPLSLIAIAGNIAPNRDGMLYIEGARLFAAHGLDAARTTFDWIFFPVLIGTLARLTGLDAEWIGYALVTLMMAALCALMVVITRRLFPEAAWAACLVVLALPAFNGYRDFVIREFGAWLFSLMACWFALRWHARPGWAALVPIHLALFVAFLFRPEVAVFGIALIIWQMFAAAAGERLRRVVQLAALPVAALAGLVVFGGLELQGRLARLAMALDPSARIDAFEALAAQFAVAVLNRHSADEAAMILLFGLVSLVVVKFIANFGLFIVPLAYAFHACPARELLARWGLLGWVFAVYFVVLVVFVTQMQFVTTRYVSFLHVLSVPLVAVGLAALFERLPRWRHALAAVAIVLAVANVVSLGTQRTQFQAAGEWLAHHVADPERAYVEDARIAYLAGWSFARARGEETDRAGLRARVLAGRYDVLALSVGRAEVEDLAWLEAASFHERAAFANRDGDRVRVFVRKGAFDEPGDEMR
jgi:hypothetical protein